MTSEQIQGAKTQKEGERVEKKMSEREKEVYNRLLAFYRWYFEHKSQLYRLNGSINTPDPDGFESLDTAALNSFTTYLKKSDFFSLGFIKTERDFWYNECQKHMEEEKPSMIRQGLKGEDQESGIGTWVADPLFKTQDMAQEFEELKSWYDESPSIEIKGNFANVDYYAFTTWVKEDGVWKLNAWH